MQTFTAAIRATFRYAFFCVSIVLILWALLPEYRIFLQSLLLGMSGSLMNGAVLFSKVWRVGQSTIDPGVRPKGTGMLTRILVAGFAVFLTIRFPETFVVSGVLIGLFLYLVLGSISVYRSFK
ncbi:ATP synthase subunit I [Brevibacillus invocatus]|uniref:ATP synthase subunit I n=1 Tax=Brevibacillus invocatus TaxID=173959 RepID=UPI00203FC05F|nr:ATP synthase subunit I [Brevibacillus invocatus]MCM3077520.1 ATP synthase subunit I [Brevibacillus invocatus]MCM3429643.1 ATP synthase subunit I [Brevibacillus invocatus]